MTEERMLKLIPDVHHVEVYTNDCRMVKFFLKDLEPVPQHTDEEWLKERLGRLDAEVRIAALEKELENTKFEHRMMEMSLRAERRELSELKANAPPKKEECWMEVERKPEMEIYTIHLGKKPQNPQETERRWCHCRCHSGPGLGCCGEFTTDAMLLMPKCCKCGELRVEKRLERVEGRANAED